MDHFANDPYNGSAYAQAAANDAAAKASANSRELDALRERVDALETTVLDLLKSLSEDGIITVE